MPVLPYINLPQNNVPDLLNSIGDTLVSAAQRKKQNEKDAADLLLRQQTADREGRLADAQIGNFQSEADARRHNQEQNDAKMHLEASKDIQASLDAGRTDEANLKARMYKMPLSQQQAPLSQRPGNTIMPPTGADLTAPPAPGQNAGEVEQANADAIASNAPAAPKPPGWNIAGTPYDPEQTKAAEEATREEEASRAEKAYEPIGYGKEAAALVRGNTGKPVEVDTLISQRQRADQAEKARQEALDQRQNFTAQQHGLYSDTPADRMARAKLGAAARVTAARTYGESPAKTDAATRGDFQAAEQTLGRTDREVNLKGLVAGDDSIRQAVSNIASGNPLQHKDAMVQLAKAVRGTSPTDAETHLLYDSLGGLADKIPQFWAHVETGDLSPRQLQLMHEAIKNVHEHTEGQIDRAYQAYRDQANDPALQNLAPSLNAGIKSRFARVGRDVPDAVEGAGQPAVLGAETKKSREAPVENPLVRAAKKQKPGAPKKSAADLAREAGFGVP